MELDGPRRWFNASTGYGTLGYGLPAAIGAKLAEPGRPVISLMGDGGIQFTLPELASAVEARVGVIVLLWNNQGYGEIKRYMERRDITRWAWTSTRRTSSPSPAASAARRRRPATTRTCRNCCATPRPTAR